MLHAALTTIPFLLSAREKTQAAIASVNQRCTEFNLPQAFETGSAETESSLSQELLRGNPDYRFEGFGVVLGLRPKLSFWVHYKKGTPEHKELGRFLVKLDVLKELGFNFFDTETPAHAMTTTEDT